MKHMIGWSGQVVQEKCCLTTRILMYYIACWDPKTHKKTGQPHTGLLIITTWDEMPLLMDVVRSRQTWAGNDLSLPLIWWFRCWWGRGSWWWGGWVVNQSSWLSQEFSTIQRYRQRSFTSNAPHGSCWRQLQCTCRTRTFDVPDSQNKTTLICLGRNCFRKSIQFPKCGRTLTFSSWTSRRVLFLVIKLLECIQLYGL